MAKTTAGIGALLLLIAAARAGAQQCPYANQLFSTGAVSCQNGEQFRCASGTWQDLGLRCADEDPFDHGVNVRPSVKEPKVIEPGVGGEAGVRQPGTPQQPAAP